MEFWGGGIHIRFLRLTLTKRVGWNLFNEACGTCTYGSFCHVSNIEDIITLLLEKPSLTFPPFLRLPTICRLVDLQRDPVSVSITASSAQLGMFVPYECVRGF
jgi:hypothetical protein